jgi:hypothetical protein
MESVSLKNSPSFVAIVLIYSRKLISKMGKKNYSAAGDPLIESFSFSPVMGLAALYLPSQYSVSEDMTA